MERKPDFCTLSPDTLGRFNWTEACRKHDEKYASEQSGSRWQADRVLWTEMMSEVRELEGSCWEQFIGRLTALIYWLAVRLFGWLWWQGPYQ